MLSADRTESDLDDLLDYVPKLRTLHANLRMLARETRADGQRTNFLSPLGGGSGVSGDPTGDTVVQREHGHTDVPATALRELVGSIAQMRKLASVAESQAMQAFPPTQPPKDPEFTDWCSSCLRIDLFEPTSRSGLCRFCYDWRLANDVVPPSALLILRKKEGKRLTTKLVAQFLPAEMR